MSKSLENQIEISYDNDNSFDYNEIFSQIVYTPEEDKNNRLVYPIKKFEIKKLCIDYYSKYYIFINSISLLHVMFANDLDPNEFLLFRRKRLNIKYTMIFNTLPTNDPYADYIYLFNEHFPFNLTDDQYKKELTEIDLNILEKSIKELKLYNENDDILMNDYLTRKIIGYEEAMMEFINTKRKQLKNKKL